MSDYPMLISNKLHSFRNFKVQIYDKPEIYNEKPAGIYICYFLPLRYS